MPSARTMSTSTPSNSSLSAAAAAVNASDISSKVPSTGGAVVLPSVVTPTKTVVDVDHPTDGGVRSTSSPSALSAVSSGDLKRRIAEQSSVTVSSPKSKKTKVDLDNVDFSTRANIVDALKQLKGEGAVVPESLPELLKCVLHCFTIPALKSFHGTRSSGSFPNLKSDCVNTVAEILYKDFHVSSKPLTSGPELTNEYVLLPLSFILSLLWVS